MATHSNEKHNSEKVNIHAKIRGVCLGDPLLRQCMESVIIRDDKPEMNGREEWGSANDKNEEKKRTKPKGEGKAKSMTPNKYEVNTR